MSSNNLSLYGIIPVIMNYLAHAYLSFNQPGIVVGNMISDFVKGKQQYDYPPAIHKGIVLHRSIDSFTDFHPVTKELKSFFSPHYRLYAGAFADVAYDHFLATDPGEFSNSDALKTFSASIYSTLEAHFSFLPERFQQMFPYMKEYDWLYNYRYPVGIKRSFEGLVRRAAYLTESEKAFEIFTLHYDSIKTCYAEFFPALKSFAAHQLEQLNNS